jgi:hypothetical protein
MEAYGYPNKEEKIKGRMKKKLSRILGVGLTVVLLFSLAVIPASASSISQLVVSFTPTTISAGANYTITFNATTAVTATADGIPYDIIIQLPLGTPTPTLVTGDVTVQATAGFGTAFGPATIDTSGITVTAATSTAGPIINIDLADEGGNIGEAAMVRVKTLLNKVTNPPTIGDYTLTVKTSADTTAVTSNTYTTTTPTILPLPGVVERYNSAGILMAQYNSINAAITAASAGDSIMVGAGTYDEDLSVATGVPISKSVTITGDAATTIIKNTDGVGANDGIITISYQQASSSVPGAVLDGFTIQGNILTANALTITGVGATVKNCVFTKAGTATTAIAQKMVTVNPGVSAATYANTITGCTFDTTLGGVADTCIDVQAANAENTIISSCTFTLDETAAGVDDTAILIDDGSVAKPVKVTGCTISGTSGVGIAVSTVTTGAVATITDCTLSGLDQALTIGSGVLTPTVTVTDSTIDACGMPISTTMAAGQAAIGVTLATSLKITNSAITNGPNDIIEVADNSENIYMMFNDLSGNAKGIDNNDADTLQTLSATHNWWGAATGPATGFNVTAGAVNNTAGYLGATATGTFSLATATVTAATTQKVDVSITTTAGATSAAAIIGVANYASNPGAATPYPAISGGYFDVYVGTPTNTTDVATIKLYGDVTTDTTAYVYSALQGTWAKCDSQGVNTTTGYIWVKTGATITPSITDLAGTAFALVAAPGAMTVPTILAPEGGEKDVSITPAFAWTEITAADGYRFELADNPYFVLPLVGLGRSTAEEILTVPFYAYMKDLDYSTAYYWRVKAVSGDYTYSRSGSTFEVESNWASGVFITEAEPEEPAPPVVIEEAPPAPPAPVIEPIVEVITPPETPITPAWIYAIIGVGALLVVAVIVLIVRTRRVA